jgi:hypothetical protein
VYRTCVRYIREMLTGPVALGAHRAADRVLAVSAALAPLFPAGGLRRGSTVSIGGPAHGGATSLGLAVLARPSAEGAWCAVVGFPELGLVAAAELGVDLDRLALVPRPGTRLVTVIAALIDGFDVVMTRLPVRLGASDARRLVARARQRSSVLVVMSSVGPRLLSTELTLTVEAAEWQGIDEGYGHLRCRRVNVVAFGRRQASRSLRASLWLPSPTGAVTVAPPLVEGIARPLGVRGEGHRDAPALTGGPAAATDRVGSGVG